MGISFSTNTWLGKMVAGFARLSFGWQYSIFIVLALLLFMPVIGNTFVADDHIVIKKVCIEGHLNTEGFFRPLSDITLYLNFLIHGIHPSGYYIFNIIIHALGALLLFHFCRRWQWTANADKQLLTAALSSLFFLAYPFHSESVVWILGRASLLGNTFAMLGLVIMVGNAREYVKIAGVCICYFIGLSGYESVLVLPAMVFVWLLSGSSSPKRYVLWLSMLTVTLLLHMLVRISVSGAVVGDYGSGFFQVDLFRIASNIAKVTGRLFLPPMASNGLLTGLFSIGMILGVFILALLWRKIRKDKPAARFLLQMIAFLLIALLVPFFFGMSTHTSESDRFLHFPSFFFCTVLAFGLVNLLYLKPAFPIAVVCILAYLIYCLQVTNNNWRKASGAVRTLLTTIEKHDKRGKLYIVNLPEEIDGAFVFRSGLKEALDIYHLQDDSVQVVNSVKRDSLLTIPGNLAVRRNAQGTFIPPQVFIVKNGDGQHNSSWNDGTFAIFCNEKDEVVYWDKKKWRRLWQKQ